MDKLPQLTDEQLKEMTFACIDAGNTTWLGVYSSIRKTHRLSRDRSIVAYKQCHMEYAAMKNETLHQKSIETINDDIRMGIKSKQQRLLELQKMLDDDSVEESVYDFQQGQSVSFTRAMKPMERAKIYELISKLQGDFAATTTALSIQKFGLDKEEYK